MSQRNVELFIGRLLTDAELRRRFQGAPRGTIIDFCEQGWELSRGEVDALAELDVRVWCLAAAGLPSRLQRCSLCSGKEREPS
ncbi:MAG TPA: Os1348 family NHLP clan protein [Polyangiaceae bacterium]|nr:Os1348 family NHLP clan protein [Polyangiaceae bacterium]